VRPIDGTDIETEAAKAASIARQNVGCRRRRGAQSKENAALLEPWLGTGLDMTDLPIPAWSS